MSGQTTFLKLLKMSAFNTAKRFNCSLCLKSYSRKHDLERHKKAVHIELEEDDSDSNEKMVKRARYADDDDDDDDNDEIEEGEIEDDSEESDQENSDIVETEDPEDNQAYQDWLEEAMLDTDEMRDGKYNKYITEGLSDGEAREKAHQKVLWAVKRIFYDHYSTFLQNSVYLEEDDTHQEISSELQRKINNGVDVKKAVSKVLAKHKTKFEGLFSYNDDDDDENNDQSEEET